MTNIAFRSAASGGASGTTQPSVSVPFGVINTDLLLSIETCGSSGGTQANLTGPTSGTWASLGGAGTDGNTGNIALWARIASSEPASYSFGKGSGSFNATAAILAFSNPDPINYLDVAASFNQSTVSQTSGTANSITTVHNNIIWVVFFMTNSGGVSHSTPTGMTQAYYQQATSTTNASSGDYESIVSAGTITGTATCNFGATQKWVSASLALTGIIASSIPQDITGERYALRNSYNW